MNMMRKSAPNPLFKLVFELGPLVVFFAANARWGLFAATGIFMVVTAISLVASIIVMRRVPIMPLVTGLVVLIFGTLTIYLNDETFIKLKPTIVNGVFGSLLLGGLAFGKPLLGYVFDAVFNLTHEGWKKLSFRWALFFFFLAGVNEIVWRTQSTDFWVAFKLFGFVPLGFAFALLQYRLIERYSVENQV